MEPGRLARQLYPPDAAPGHAPSTDGPDVLAVKRFCAHLGAWPWDPPSWDEAYSNSFAHGSSRGAGLAGVQRWAKIKATGWFGEATFNFARSVLIPQGRTHAGEPAWDNQCEALMEQAFELEHPPAPMTTLREVALDVATSEIGVTESPAGSNEVIYSEWYGMVGPWCAMFVTWCFDAHDGASPSFDRNAGRYAYVPYIVADARGARYGLSVTSSPIPGDLVCYDWERNGEFDHVGIFEEWVDRDAGSFDAIEGNTSWGDNSNGGEVMRRARNVAGQSTVFVRVAEP